MAVYVQIGELEEVTTKTPDITYSASYFENTHVRSSIYHGGADNSDTTSYFSGPTFLAPDIWVHFRLFIDQVYSSWVSPTNTTSMVRIMSGGTPRLRLVGYTLSQVKLEIWDGASWTVLGEYTKPIIQGNLWNDIVHTWDIHATVGASATVTVYLDNTVVISVTGVDTTFGSTITEFDNVVFSTANDNHYYSVFRYYWSEIIVADWNTIGSKVVIRAPDANGFYSGWTNGDYTVVDELTPGTDYATSDTADQRVDWSMASYPSIASNEQVASLQITTLINRDSIGPQQANFYVRAGGTNYDNSIMSLPLVQNTKTVIYTTNPATSAVWTPTELNDATYGIRSRT